MKLDHVSNIPMKLPKSFRAEMHFGKWTSEDMWKQIVNVLNCLWCTFHMMPRVLHVMWIYEVSFMYNKKMQKNAVFQVFQIEIGLRMCSLFQSDIRYQLRAYFREIMWRLWHCFSPSLGWPMAIVFIRDWTQATHTWILLQVVWVWTPSFIMDLVNLSCIIICLLLTDRLFRPFFRWVTAWKWEFSYKWAHGGQNKINNEL